MKFTPGEMGLVPYLLSSVTPTSPSSLDTSGPTGPTGTIPYLLGSSKLRISYKQKYFNYILYIFLSCILLVLHTTGTADTEIFTIPIETEIFTISNSSPNSPDTAPNSTPQVPSLSPNTTPFTKSSSIRSTTNSGSTYADSEYHCRIYDQKQEEFSFHILVLIDCSLFINQVPPRPSPVSFHIY